MNRTDYKGALWGEENILYLDYVHVYTTNMVIKMHQVIGINVVLLYVNYTLI